MPRVGRPASEPGEGGPDPVPKPPKPQQPPQASAENAFTMAEQGRPLPTAYGTPKVPVLLIEKKPPLKRAPTPWFVSWNVGNGEVADANGNAYKCLKPGTTTTGNSPSGSGADPSAWAGSTTYSVGDIRTNAGNAYQCRTGGLSAGSGGPTGTGADIVDFVAHWTYLGATPFPVVGTGDGIVWKYLQQLPYPLYSQQFLGALCEGEVLGGLTLWWDKERIPCPTLTSIGKMLFLWTGPDAANQVMVSGFGWDSSGYQHTALIGPINFTSGGVFTDTQPDLPAIAVELKAVLFGASTLDAAPADVVNDILTHTRRGCAWPSGRVGTSITGAGATTYRTYCDAAGLRFSMLIDTQKTALQILTDILNATNSDACWSSGELKIVPLADASITTPVYGAVNYVPVNTAQYNLGVSDFLDKGRPVQVRHRADDLCFNSFPVQYIDRLMGYSTTTVEDPEQSDVELRGKLRGGTLALPMVFPDGRAAVMLSRNLAQRSLNIRNTYTFRLPWRYIGLEPMDIVTLTEAQLGLSLTPVRITRMQENADRTLTITAEDYPAGVAASVPFTPAGGDGYQANEPTATAVIPTSLDGTNLGVKTGTVPVSGTTASSSFDNLFTNGDCEAAPPPGADTTTAEWAGRLASGSAYSGGFVRELSTAQNGKQSLGAPATVNGGAWGNEPTTQSQLALELPCSKGWTFYVEAQAKWVTVTGAQACGVGLYFLGADRKILGAAAADVKNTGGTAAGWALTQAYGVAPAGTVWVRLFCFMDSTLGTAKADFDAIYARRQVESNVVAKLGGYFLDEVQYAALKAIGRQKSGAWPNIVVDRAWYRGNDDPGVRGGAPDISTVAATVFWDTGNKHCRVHFTVQPAAAAADNLDAMRYAKISIYRQSAAGTTGTLTGVCDYYVAQCDRLYMTPGTDNSANNKYIVSATIIDGGISGGFPAMLITFYNAQGPSETHCFYSAAGFVSGGTLTDNGQAWPAGLTGGTGGGGGGGGSGGDPCLDPETPVLVGPRRMAPLRMLRAGDKVWTRPEQGGVMGFHVVGSVRHAQNLRCRVTLKDGRSFVSSVNHLLNVRGIWRRADWLQAGEEIQGDPGGHVRGVEYLGEGPVVQLRIPTAQTYFAGDGVFHHNTLKP